MKALVITHVYPFFYPLYFSISEFVIKDDGGSGDGDDYPGVGDYGSGVEVPPPGEELPPPEVGDSSPPVPVVVGSSSPPVPVVVGSSSTVPAFDPF